MAPLLVPVRSMALVLVLLIGSTDAVPANAQESYSSSSARLRSEVLARHDRLSPPDDPSRNNSYSSAGTDVRMQIRFFKVDHVSTAEGTIGLKVWLRLSWRDTRLAWNPEDFGAITEVYYEECPGELCTIWVPDITHYNSLSGLEDSFESSTLTVQSNGDVFWSRPGLLEVLCKFSGLINFPKDQLVCKVEFAGWGYSGLTQGIELDGLGYDFNAQEETAGPSYQQYSIQNVSCYRRVYYYSSTRDEPWPALVYEIRMKRHGQACAA